MKLASFLHDGRHGFGPVEEDSIADVSAALNVRALADVIGETDAVARIAAATSSAPRLSFSAVELLAPVPAPGRIICIGLNYRTHIAEMGREIAEYPAIFMRYPDSIVGHNSAILRPKVSEQFDYEGELAFIIGTGGRHIAKADALAAVAGYTIFNDGSVRDFQRHTHQFGAGKNFWRSGACGPWLVTPDAIPALGDETLTTRLNDRIVQQTKLNDLVFGVEDLIVYLSEIMPLNPGDVIATGTTGGVGAARKPPVWMKPGDRIEVEITGIGTLSNTVADEA